MFSTKNENRNKNVPKRLNTYNFSKSSDGKNNLFDTGKAIGERMLPLYIAT